LISLYFFFIRLIQMYLQDTLSFDITFFLKKKDQKPNQKESL